MADDFDPRAPVEKPPANHKCYICGEIGQWPLVRSPSYSTYCFECDVARGTKNIVIDDYHNDIKCTNVIKDSQCTNYGCQKWAYNHRVCTTCKPPPKPVRQRKPLVVHFKASWLEADAKIPGVGSSNLAYLDKLIANRPMTFGISDVSEIESAIVQREDNGDAKVITELHTTVDDLWKDYPEKVTMILHRRKR